MNLKEGNAAMSVGAWLGGRSARGVLALALLMASAGFCGAWADDGPVWRGGAAPNPTAWDAPGNWVGEAGPTETDQRETRIPAGCASYPRISQDAVTGGSLRIEDGAKLTVAGARLTVEKGLFVAIGGEVEIADGGEIWTDIFRDPVASRGHAATNLPHRTDSFDVGLKLKTSFQAAALLPNLRESGGELPRNWLFEIGAEIPAGTALVNIAPYADIRCKPYAGLTRNFVDIDPSFRTFSFVEPGVPIASKVFDFHFDSPQWIAEVKWTSPFARWSLLGDSNGDGEFDRIIAMDLAEATSRGDSWKHRTVVDIRLWPAEPFRAIRMVDLAAPGSNNGSNIYDFQILSPADRVAFSGPHPHAVMRGEHLVGSPPMAAVGEEINVEPAPPEKQLPRGFHIEPWMFGLDEWIDRPADERPPLSQHEPFTSFVAALRKHHANTVNLWPPKKFNDPRGQGVYEMPLLWPSRFDRHSLDENILAKVAEAFREKGIRFMSMTRTSYPKPAEDMPEVELKYPDLPMHQLQGAKYLPGIVQEQALSGVDGVGIGFDEQEWHFLSSPAAYRWGPPGELFTKRYGMAGPNDVEDTVAYRKWVDFGYRQFAEYLANASAIAKQANPGVITKCPVSATIGSTYNDRIKIGIAEDILQRTADLDYTRAYAYLGWHALGHYVTAFATKVTSGGRLDRKTVSLHNCPWADSPETYPGFYLHYPPIYQLASPISAVMHGGNMPLIWRWNWIFRDGYEKQVEAAYGMLGTLSAWGITEAGTPKSIAVVRSRASEDWWQIRGRFNPQGDIMDQTRGHVLFKAVLEILLTGGYPFDVLYLDYPDELAEALPKYDLVILPFPYSVSRDSAEVIGTFVAGGKPVIALDRLGETDEWGEPRKSPVLAPIFRSNDKAVLFGQDLTRVGQHREVDTSFRKLVDGMLGSRKPTFLESYGNDVEMALLEKSPTDKFLALMNWTERPVTVDAGVNMPPGSYRVRVTSPRGSHVLAIGGKTLLDHNDLAKFRMLIEPWDAQVLFVSPAE
jgi:hypothetical protein